MAKTHHLKHPTNFDAPVDEKEALGQPIDELKKQDYSALSAALVRKGEFRLLIGDKSG